MSGPPQVEAEVRLQIDRRLQAKGWILDPGNPGRDIFVERSVLPHLSAIHRNRLSGKSPDYTLFCDGSPVAVLEAKKPAVSIHAALKQGCDYADRLDINYVFACNGPTFKTFHTPTGHALYLNKVEVTDPLGPSKLRSYWKDGTHQLLTLPNLVIKSRGQLILVFEKLNNTLRSAGIRAGLDRFTEFANLLFLKLLSERAERGDLWADLLRRSESDLPAFLNQYVIRELRSTYDSNVLSKTQVDGTALRAIIRELSPLCLSSVDEDVKGVAFEHFLRRTTSVQNDLGEYFTPRRIVRFMVRLLNPQFGKTVFDPFCGTGGFLTEAFRHLGHQTNPSHDAYVQLHEKSLYGQEITKNARIAKMNMILFGDGHSGVVQGDSLAGDDQLYDYVLSNIPFSLQVDSDAVKAVDPIAKDGDEACLLRCFNSLRLGGAMAVIVPEGLVVNHKHKGLWQHLSGRCRIRAIASLPRGSFAPYTDAATRIVYLTGKGTKQTEWFYSVTLEEDHSNSIRMEEFQFFYEATEDPVPVIPEGISITRVKNSESSGSFYIEQPWKVDPNVETIPLHEIADISNGAPITEATAVKGDIPVIAGGRGTVPYTHNEPNNKGGCFTISKSGAYSGYVWWHQNPIWASDCMVLRSKKESVYGSFYLYLCMKSKQDEIYLRQQGTGQPHVYAQHIRNFPIPLLSRTDQERYVDQAREAVTARLEAERKERGAVNEAVTALYEIYRGCH